MKKFLIPFFLLLGFSSIPFFAFASATTCPLTNDGSGHNYYDCTGVDSGSGFLSGHTYYFYSGDGTTNRHPVNYGGTFGSLFNNGCALNGNTDINANVFSTIAPCGSGSNNFFFTSWNSNNPIQVDTVDSFDLPKPTFAFPLQSSTIPDFQNWVISVSNPTSSISGMVTVHYGQSSSSQPFSDSVSYAPFISANPLPITKKVLLNPVIQVSGSSTWYAYAELTATGYDVTSSIVSFSINPQASAPTSTAGVLGGGFVLPAFYISPSSTASSTFQCNGLLDIAGCTANVLNSVFSFFLRPSTQVTQYLSNSVNALENVFPFDIAFGILNQTSNALTANVTSTQTLTLSAYPLAYSQANFSVDVLTSSTLSNAFGTPVKNNIFTFEDIAMYASTLGAIFITVFHKAHDPHGSNEQKPA